MSSKMDGVKISINHDAEDLPAKKTLPKRKQADESAPLKSKTRRISSVAQKGGFFSSLITFVVTAALVGGVIYAWQNKVLEKSVEEVRGDARSARMDLEKRMENLKNELSGVESEFEALKTTKEELEERVKLLDGAKKDFSSEDLGLSFTYPAIFGDVIINFEEAGSSTKFTGKFSKIESLDFGGIKKDFVSASAGSSINFLESQGYYVKKDKYYFLPAGESDSEDREIIPTKIINTKSGEALFVDKKSFVAKEGLAEVEIGENIGALVNLKSENYKGIAFVNKDFGVMPLESFESLIKTIEVK